MKLYGLTSNKSRVGLYRIGKIVYPDIIVENLLPSKTNWEELKEPYDGIIGHNRLDVPHELRNKTLIYGLQSVVISLQNKLNLRKDFQKYPPKAFWVNSEAAKLELEKIGIKARTMYRPNKIFIPEKRPALPEGKKILWHWLEDGKGNRYYEKYRDYVIRAMKQLKDIEILMFPINKALIDAPHVKAIGKVNLPKILSMIHGMIRICDLLHFARSTFDIIGYGRFLMCYSNNDPFVSTITDLNEIASMVHLYFDNCEHFDTRGMWQYAKDNFSEEAMHEKWVRGMRKVFE